MAGYIPLVPRPQDPANQKDEFDQHLASHNENLAFRDYFESSETGLNACGFDGLYVDRGGAYAKKIIERFGYERTMYMLANTVLLKEYDGRFSHQIKAWANSVCRETPQEGVRQYILDSVNPGVLDIFAKSIIRMYEKSKLIEQNKEKQLDSTEYSPQEDLQM